MHWQTLPNRALFSEINDRNHPDEPLLSVTIGQGVIRQSDLLADSAKKDSSNGDKTNYKLVQPGDIAYNKMRAWQGAVGVSDYRGIVSPAYIVVRPRREQNPVYCHYLLRTPAFAKEAERWSYGITSDQWSLRAEDFKQIYCSLPPKQEQNRIVHFLADLDRRINRLIRGKRRLIELLKEQKQAIIQRAVTRGLDPNVRFKPSGIDWLGDMPEHWEIRRLKNLFSEIDDRSEAGDEVLLSLRMYKGLVPHTIVSDKPISSHNLIGFKRTKPNDVVMNRMRASSGMFAVTSTPGIVSPDYAVLRRIANIMPGYYVHLFKTPPMRAIFRAESKGLGTGEAGFLRLYTDRFGAIKVPVPPMHEQAAILSHLQNATRDLVTTQQKAAREISLATEYRMRLIADVVTGKLDARRVELPDQDEAEVPDEVEVSDDDEAEHTEYNGEIAHVDADG